MLSQESRAENKGVNSRRSAKRKFGEVTFTDSDSDEDIAVAPINHDVFIETKKVGEKKDGVAKGYIGTSPQGEKHMIKFIARGIINYIPNAINEFVSYPLVSTLLKGTGILCPFIGLQRGGAQVPAGIAIKFINGVVHVKRTPKVHIHLQILCVFRAVIGDDDWCPPNILVQRSTGELITVDHGKVFMARPDSPANFLEYFYYLFRRWYDNYKLDKHALKGQLEGILQVYKENQAVIVNDMGDRVAILRKELGDDCLKGTTFALRTKDGLWPVNKQFNSFDEYFIYVQEMLVERMNMLPKVILLLEKELQQEVALKNVSVSNQLYGAFKPVRLIIHYCGFASTTLSANSESTAKAQIILSAEAALAVAMVLKVNNVHAAAPSVGGSL